MQPVSINEELVKQKFARVMVEEDERVTPAVAVPAPGATTTPDVAAPPPRRPRTGATGGSPAFDINL